ncbi:hypothetical protein [Photobacterium sanguinicancri]|uniref:hypothetical protein n=1 Tax=Photobacterium sanguinicancri TaxID=875932 RepID=UPI0021C2AA0A|nr:hypothetical protein [Photobacterium sanguinicancri]
MKFNLSSKLSLILSILGLLAPAGYLVGLNFHQGVLASYGIDSSIFSLSTYDVYVYAYFAFGHMILEMATQVVELLNLIFLPPNVYISIALFLAVVVFVYRMLVQKDNVNKKDCSRFILIARKSINYISPKNNRFTEALFLTSGLSYIGVTFLLFLASIAFFWFLLPQAAYSEGKDVSKYQLEKFYENGCNIPNGEEWSQCHKLIDSNGQVVLEGLLAAQNKDYVAFYTGTQSVVLKFPNSATLIKLRSNITKTSS